MRRIHRLAGIAAALCVCALASCESMKVDQIEPVPSVERKTLKRIPLAPDAVVFDVLIAHIPPNERELVSQLWKDVDEQELEPSVREALRSQGFRAGLIGASPPDSLTKILALKGRELRSSIEEKIDFSKTESALAPVAYSKPVNLRAGMKSMIEVRSEVIPSIPLLERARDGSLAGKTYANVSPVLSAAIEQSADGSVLFSIAPLLRYGAPQTVTRYQHGQLVRTQERPTKNFDSLRFSLALRPGQFLVIGATDSGTKALGRYFFSDGGDDFEQSVLVLRLLVTQHDEQFDRFPDFRELVANELDDSSFDPSDGEETVVSFTREEVGSQGFGDYEPVDLDSPGEEPLEDLPVDDLPDLEADAYGALPEE